MSGCYWHFCFVGELGCGLFASFFPGKLVYVYSYVYVYLYVYVLMKCEG